MSERCRHQKIDKDGNFWDAYCIRKKDHEGDKHIHKGWKWWSENV